MAIAFDAANQGKATATNATVTYTHTITGTNTILLVGIYNQNAGGLTTVTIGGNNMTLIDSQSDGNVSIAYLYYYIGAVTGTLTVTRGTTTNTLYVQSASYTGAKQSAQPDASTKGQNISGTSTMTGTLTVVANNSWLSGVFADGATSVADGTGIHRGTIQDSVVCIFDSNGARSSGSNTLTTTNGGTEQTNTAYVLASLSPFTVSSAHNLSVTGAGS